MHADPAGPASGTDRDFRAGPTRRNRRADPTCRARRANSLTPPDRSRLTDHYRRSLLDRPDMIILRR